MNPYIDARLICTVYGTVFIFATSLSELKKISVEIPRQLAARSFIARMLIRQSMGGIFAFMSTPHTKLQQGVLPICPFHLLYDGGRKFRVQK